MEQININIGISSTLAAASLNGYGKLEPGDTYSDDGLIICGACGEPKQFKTPELPLVPSFVASVACRCQQQIAEAREQEKERERFIGNLERMGEGIAVPPGRYAGDTFTVDDGENAEAGRICRLYVEHWEDVRKRAGGLLLYGSPGTGKTFYAHCIANELIAKRVPVVVTSIPRILRAVQGFNRGLDRNAVIDALTSFRLVVIDDLGTERNTPFALEIVQDVIDSLYAAKIATIITTNLQGGDTDTIEMQRIFDRLGERCRPVKMAGQSRRTRTGSESWRGILD